MNSTVHVGYAAAYTMVYNLKRRVVGEPGWHCASRSLHWWAVIGKRFYRGRECGCQRFIANRIRWVLVNGVSNRFTAAANSQSYIYFYSSNRPPPPPFSLYMRSMLPNLAQAPAAFTSFFCSLAGTSTASTTAFRIRCVIIHLRCFPRHSPSAPSTMTPIHDRVKKMGLRVPDRPMVRREYRRRVLPEALSMELYRT